MSDYLQRQREIAYAKLHEFGNNRIDFYNNLKLSRLLSKDIIMFAARGVKSADEFVEETFRAIESSSEETVMGNVWQAIVAAISDNTLDTGDMLTERDGDLYVCELKSQTNTTNSSSFPQELRELREKVAYHRRFSRASGQKVLPAYCVLRDKNGVDEWRTYTPDRLDLANQDIAGFEYRYLVGSGFWQWLVGCNSEKGLVTDVSIFDADAVVAARARCLQRLKLEMTQQLDEYGFAHDIQGVLNLSRELYGV